MILKSANWPGGTITYKIYGQGIPVVLLHGFGEDSNIWDKQIDALQHHCMLIVPDLPGTGNSEWEGVNGQLSMVNEGVNSQLSIVNNASPFTIHHSPFTPTIDELAESVYHLLTTEKIDACYLLGHSMGGYITLAFAGKYASMLKGFGLIHSTAFADSEEKKQNRLRGIELMEQYGGYSFLKNTIPNLFGEKFKTAHYNEVMSLIEKAASFSTPALQAYYKAMRNRPDNTAILKSNPLPVLFVMGTEDVAAPLDDVLKQTHLPLKSYIHILEGIGHMGMWEATERLNEILVTFIQQ